MCEARRWQVSLHLGMGPLHHVCDSGTKKELIWPHERLRYDPRTEIEITSVVAATENPRHFICERDGVRTKAVSGERTPDGPLLQYITGGGTGLTSSKFDRWGLGAPSRLVNGRCTGRLGDGLTRRRARSNLRSCLRWVWGRGSHQELNGANSTASNECMGQRKGDESVRKRDSERRESRHIQY